MPQQYTIAIDAMSGDLGLHSVIGSLENVLKVYKDHLGYRTVGVGHLIIPSDEEWGVGVGHPITQTRADELLFYDLANVLKECEDHFHNNWKLFV